jgi:hypothetical protein
MRGRLALTRRHAAECSGSRPTVGLSYVDMLVALVAGDVGGEEVDAVAVEVAACSVVVLGGAGVGVAGEDLCVAEVDAGVEGVGDGGVRQRVGADVPRDTGGPPSAPPPAPESGP